MRTLIQAAGFRELAWLDVSKRTLAWLQQRAAAFESPAPFGLALLLGELFVPAFGNLAQNLNEDRVHIVQAVFQRV